MLIRKPEDVDSQVMTMAGAEKVTMRLMVGRDDGAPTFAMRLFEVEPGGHTPLHQHNYEHEVMVVAGQGQVVDNAKQDDAKPIEAGDVIYMPPNEMHQFRNTGDEVLKFVCLVPTTFDCGTGLAMTPGS